MARFRKNEATAAKRRAKIYVTLDDGTAPAPAATTFPAIAAFVALTGTHHATLTWNATGVVGNAVTIQTIADGTGTGSLTHTGNAYVFHYQTGVTTMANFVTAAAGVFAFTGHTPADVLASTGDTQGPLSLAGGVAYGWEVSQGASTFVAATGTVTNCTNAASVGIDGLFQYEATQSELNFLASEFVVKLQYPGFKTTVYTFDMNDAADFDSVDEASHTYGDTHRLQSSVIAAKVADFGTGTLTFRDLLDTKNRLTVLTSAIGRIASTIGDLLP